MFIFDSLVMINSCDGEGWHAVWRHHCSRDFFLILHQDFLSKNVKKWSKMGSKKKGRFLQKRYMTFFFEKSEKKRVK